LNSDPEEKETLLENADKLYDTVSLEYDSLLGYSAIALMMEVLRTFETLVYFIKTTRRYISEARSSHSLL
jgi:hypothetical protein